ncbi:MAG: lytic transglycosylase domain-containing protein [Bacillota bacterium]|jgi:soluble lytic murein transglycosylase
MNKRHNKKNKAASMIVIIIVLLIIFFITKDEIARQLIYPDHYYEEILIAAEANNIDVNLLFAVVKEESGFNKDALSSVGAQGLMQLMPDTASWICKQAPFDYDPVNDVWDPGANIMMGAWYLNWLSDTYYYGNIAAAIAAYNAGQQNVNNWLQEGSWDGSFANAADIPFSETAAFLQSVNKSREKYAKLYSL